MKNSALILSIGLVLCSIAVQALDGQIRQYYVAAECELWDFAPSQFDLAYNQEIPEVYNLPLRWWKARYVQYTDASFSTKVAHPEELGILGPTLRAEVGDEIHVSFLNRVTPPTDAQGYTFEACVERPLTIHPHGVKYQKSSEGALYNPADDGAHVEFGELFNYVWEVPETAGPTDEQTSSIVWLYHSHHMEVGDVTAGLWGTIIIVRRGSARSPSDPRPNDVDREFVVTLFILDQNTEVPEPTEAPTTPIPKAKGKFKGKKVAAQPLLKRHMAQAKKQNVHNHVVMEDEEQEGFIMHSMNGYLFGNLDGLNMNEGETVRWYATALGNEVDMHTLHWHANSLEFQFTRTDVIAMLPASMYVADMTANNPGTWLVHCHVSDHMLAGMYTRYTVVGA